jgi:hypothetical protein
MRGNLTVIGQGCWLERIGGHCVASAVSRGDANQTYFVFGDWSPLFLSIALFPGLGFKEADAQLVTIDPC